MDRDLTGGSDYGRDDRDIGDEPPPGMRDHAPDILGPIDSSAPVSGHVRATEIHASIADSPEHDWDAASAIVIPLLRPIGTQGMRATEVDATALAADAVRHHSQPIVDEAPCDLAVVYAIPGPGFDVIVNADHLLSWGVDIDALQTAALRNLESWSASAAWTDEVSGERRLVSSDTGDGWDATRILLPEVRRRLASELGAVGRVLIGLPERHLLIAGAPRPDDDEFAGLFGEFIVEQSGAADEPVDRRVFELVDDRLVEFSGLAAPA
jgi:hypothetical protein